MMPGIVRIVTDVEPVPIELRCEPSWERLSWDMFFAQPSRRADLVILIGSESRERSIEVFRRAAALPARSCVLAILHRDSSPEEFDLAFAVADDVVVSPEREDVVQKRIRRLLIPASAEFDSAYESLIAELASVNLVGRDPSFLRVAMKIPTCARADLPVLITGETGTGKEVFARAIHSMSRRCNHAFIPVDCGGIPDHLFENEFFGHVRGAYTDARGEQKGLAELADGGTLFLDEIDSLSLGTQAKLLRFLQDRQFKPLGAERYAHSDVKLLAATNGCLEELVAEKRFRQDLYFRLNVLHLELPSIRERPVDIALLAEHFLAIHCQDGVRRRFAPAALKQLGAYSWPGNVRQLLNVVQRAIVFSPSATINVCDILPHIPPTESNPFREARQELVQGFERQYVEDMLRRHNGNVTHAARDAGKERRAFGKLVKKYGISARAVGQS